VFGGHVEHAVCVPETDEYVPAVHGVQFTDAAMLIVPYVPDGQAAPRAVVYVTDVAEPELGEYTAVVL
jgi:hypothetical protein